jgi:MFS family permease
MFRVGAGALPFLLPLMLQIGFHKTPFESGLITFATAIGAMTNKAVIALILKKFGFHNVLTVNAVIASLCIAACGAFTAATPVPVMIGVLLLGGFFRSVQFTSINTIGYAEVEPRRMSRATSLVSVAQQLSTSVGVALGALVVETVLRFDNQPTLTAAEFPPAFLIVAGVAAASCFIFARLPRDAGAELANRTPAPTEPADDQRAG